jgi:hypothetical protein
MGEKEMRTVTLPESKTPRMTNPSGENSSPQSLYLTQLSPGTVLDIETQNHTYNVKYLGHGAAWISGHPRLCPEPRRVNILGSGLGRSTLKINFLGQGMQLEFQEPGCADVAITSPIQSIHVRHWGDPLTAQTSTAVAEAKESGPANRG